MPSLAAPERLKGLSLCFPLIDGAHRVGGVDLAPPLPIDVPPGETREARLFLPGMAIADDNRPISVRLVLEPSGLGVQVNETDLGAKRVIPVDVLRDGDNVFVLKNNGGAAVRATRQELELTYP